MSGAKDVLKVQHLMALALGSNGEEARTAAALACRLIRDKGLVLMAPDDQRLLPPAPAARPYPPPYSPPAPAPPPPAPAPPSSPPRPPASPSASTSPPVDAASEDLWIRARRICVGYASVCRFCWKNVQVGEYAFWARSEGVICETCHDTMFGG